MPNFLSIIMLCLLIGAAPALADQQQPAAPPAQITPADRQVAAVMEILQLMDLAEEIDMIKDMNYLIEDDQNENQTD